MGREVLAYKCKKCGQLHYPYRMRCKKCGHTEWQGADVVFDLVPLPKDGKLLTFTNVYALPPDFEAVSLSLGIVDQLTLTQMVMELQTAMMVAPMTRIRHNQVYAVAASQILIQIMTE